MEGAGPPKTPSAPMCMCAPSSSMWRNPASTLLNLSRCPCAMAGICHETDLREQALSQPAVLVRRLRRHRWRGEGDAPDEGGDGRGDEGETAGARAGRHGAHFASSVTSPARMRGCAADSSLLSPSRY